MAIRRAGLVLCLVAWGLAACVAPRPEPPAPFDLPAPTEEEFLVHPAMVGAPMAKVDTPFTAAAATTGGWGGHPPLPGVLQDLRWDFAGLPAAITSVPPSQTAESIVARIGERLRTGGRYRYVPHASACAAPVLPPRLRPDSGAPVVGAEVRLVGERIDPAWVPIVMAQIEKAPVDRDADLSLFGMTACRLALDLERIVFFAPGPTGLVTREPNGNVVIRWIPEPPFAGFTVTWQLLCLVPRTIVPSERIVSGGLQSTVGL